MNTLEKTAEALRKNNFTCEIVADSAAALKRTKELIPEGSVCSFGGSLTVARTGIKDMILEQYETLNPYEPGLDEAEKLDVRRKAFAADWYLTGTNGITRDGTLVNLDCYGNRVAAQIFGPSNVLIVAGKNKIVPDLAAAEERIRSHTAPENNKRLGRNTPCVKTGKCVDCSSPERICNYLVVARKCCPRVGSPSCWWMKNWDCNFFVGGRSVPLAAAR